MKILNLTFLLALVLIMWLLSEFGPEEARGAMSICGIGVAAIALVKLTKQTKKK